MDHWSAVHSVTCFQSLSWSSLGKDHDFIVGIHLDDWTGSWLSLSAAPLDVWASFSLHSQAQDSSLHWQSQLSAQSGVENWAISDIWCQEWTILEFKKQSAADYAIGVHWESVWSNLVHVKSFHGPTVYNIPVLIHIEECFHLLLPQWGMMFNAKFIYSFVRAPSALVVELYVLCPVP